MTGEPTEQLGHQIEALGEAVRRLGATAQQPGEPQSSIDLSQTAKGATQVAVKVYSSDAHQAANVAQELFDQLTGRYRQPVTDGRPA
jgi:hypothetical protein